MVRTIALAYRDAYSGLSKEVWILSVALMVNRAGSMVLAFLTLYLTQRLSFSMIEAGAIFSIYGMGSIVGAYLGGRLIKPLGAVRVQIVGLILSVPFYLLIPTLSSWTAVAVGMFCLSLVVDSVRPANGIAVAQYTPTRLQTRAYGLQRMACNLGYAVGPALGGVLAEIDFAWLFVVDGVSTGVGGLFLLWFFGFRRYAKGDAAAEQQRLSEQQTNPGGSPLKDGHFLCFISIILLVSIVFFQFHATYPKYLEEFYALSKPQIGILFSLNTVMIVVFEMLLVNWVRRFSLLRAIGWGGFFACLGFGILPASQAPWFAVLSMVVITTGEMFLFPLATGFVAHRGTGRDQSMYMSWYVMTYSIASLIAPLLGTVTYQANPHLLWYTGLGVGLISIVGLSALAGKVAAGDKIENCT